MLPDIRKIDRKMRYNTGVTNQGINLKEHTLKFIAMFYIVLLKRACGALRKVYGQLHRV